MDMARRFRDPSVQRFNPTQLVNSYNGLLNNPAHHYAIGGYECAMEFLSAPAWRGDGILNNIEFAPGFLTTFEQQGFCPRCLAHQMQVLVSTKTELNCSTLIYFSHIQSVFSTLRFTLEINLST